ncbi:MAG TPA: phosphoribosylamine--glycine ligase [Gemmatimonadaceae bacterium]|nr:phosphoribosylamine--glycine ligase [Gemmatimonadaceae bacterium]
MKLLLVGNGAREHALAWKLLQDDPSLELICASGNAGLAEIAECIPLRSDDVRGLLGFAIRADVDLTIVGPEAPLAEGIVDSFHEAGRSIFGPTRAAAEIETSKRFSKTLMQRAGVPTARATHHRRTDDAIAAVREMGTPAVIKASGLAAGKGVVIARSSEEAERAINSIMRDRIFGDAGAEVLVEEFMSGEELSIFALTDGERFVMMRAAQDHKRLLDGDLGPNTGGMGAYSPVAIATDDLLDIVADKVFEPVLAAMRSDARPFTGLLYAGLMLTSDGPRVVEFNCRFGDPETEAILPLMRSSLLDPLRAIASGESLSGMPSLSWHPQYAVTTVIAAHGYPDGPRTGDSVRLPATPGHVHVFHGATSRDHDTGEVTTSGGRVFAITGVADSIHEAAARSQAHAERISFEGKQFRRDIARRELERSARAS